MIYMINKDLSLDAQNGTSELFRKRYLVVIISVKKSVVNSSRK